MHDRPYARLAAMVGLHLAAMFALMYAMVDRFANVLPNLNQLYMAGLMTAPMLLFELILMGSMYPKKRLNLGLGAAAVALLIDAFTLICAQTAIRDAAFEGALKVAPAYVGYLAANLLTAQTRGWLLGQGHCAAANRYRHMRRLELVLQNARPC